MPPDYRDTGPKNWRGRLLSLRAELGYFTSTTAIMP